MHEQIFFADIYFTFLSNTLQHEYDMIHTLYAGDVYEYATVVTLYLLRSYSYLHNVYSIVLTFTVLNIMEAW